jgi:outer membrane protein
MIAPRVARAVAIAIAVGSAVPIAQTNAQTNVAQKKVAPVPLAPQPTPFPINTLAPLTGETTLPYPAYGTPVPGVNAGTRSADLPATLSLQGAIAIGFARSPLLASARADVGVASAAARLAGVGLLPSIAGSASLDQSRIQSGGSLGSLSTGTTTGNGTGTAAGGTSIGTSSQNAIRASGSTNVTSGSLGVSLRQLIFDGGRIAASVRAAQRNETAFADTYRRELQTVAFDVASAYYSYLSAQRTVQVDLEIVRQDQVQEDLVRAQVRAGTEARAQIATAQLPTAQDRLAVVRAQGAELSAGAAFANAMGLDANVRVQPVDDAPIFTNTPVSSIAIPSYDDAVKRALALRPDYDAALQSIAQARETLRAARLGRSPSLSGSASTQENSSGTTLGNFRNSTSVGVTLTLPIFDQNLTADNTAQALAGLDRASAQRQNTALNLSLNIKQTLANFVTAFAALEQTQQEYATAISNVRSTQAQYRAGVTTLPLLLNAQTQLARAQSDQVTTVYTVRQAEQAYLFAIGANYDTAAALGSRRIDPIPVKPDPIPLVGPKP